MSSLASVLLIGCSVFFALNMGGSGFAPAFSAALGAKMIRRGPALVLFTICVGGGALLVGTQVAKTLSGGLVPAATFDRQTALVVISSSAAALFLANLLKVPESTSWVTVFAVSSLGMMRSNLNTHLLLYKILPAWIIVPILSFLITWSVCRLFYPLRGWNFRIYEHLSKHEWKLRIIVLVSSAYLAAAVGHNVANVVAPLSSAGLFSLPTGLILFTPLFGLGGALFFSPTKTLGVEVVPLGLYSAALINVVVGTLVLIVTRLGIPQSLVHAHVLSVIAISFTKDGSYQMVRHPVIRKMVLFWVVSPMIAAGLVAVTMSLLK